jgi:hypothetical protein
MGETAGAVVAVGADMVHCPFLNFDDEKSFEAQEKRGSLWNTVYSTLPSNT